MIADERFARKFRIVSEESLMCVTPYKSRHFVNSVLRRIAKAEYTERDTSLAIGTEVIV
jgi:hypothetical protein